jgi:hypothetical protein
MKNVFKFRTIGILSLLISFTSAYQPLMAQIKIDNISIGSSVWLRTYNTPDERSVLVNPPSENGQTNPMVMVHLGAEIGLFKGFGIQTRVGYGSNKYSSTQELGGFIREEKLNQTIIPGSVGLMYKFPLNIFESNKNSGFSKATKRPQNDWLLSISGGLNRYFLQHQISRTINQDEGSIAPSNYNGNNYGGYAQLGIQKLLGESFSISLDTRYNTGEYFQKVYSESMDGEFVRNKISIQGLEFGLRLAYIFPTN